MRSTWLVYAILLSTLGCGGGGDDPLGDAGDGGIEAGDANLIDADSATNDADATPVDALEAGLDADLPSDGDTDSEVDAAGDGGDAGTDAADAGPPDGDAAPADAAMPPSDTVVLVFPWNGFATGSGHVPDGAAVVDHPLRPKLMWLPVADATEYEVELDDSCELATFRSCTFASPELSTRAATTSFRPAAPLPVSMVAPVGRRYYWRVRACMDATCLPWSEVRYLDVGRHSDDFNGDGYADLLVGAPLNRNGAVNEGNAFVYYGSPSGVGTAPNVMLDNPRNQGNGRFGFSVASAGDLNGDGYADVVVGAHAQDNPEFNEGNAFVYYGSVSGVGAASAVTLDNPTDQLGGEFGSSVASAGDVNGDGYADLLIGAPLNDNGTYSEGSAFVYHGSPSGVGTAPNVTLDNPANWLGGKFGYSVGGAGDVNGDGYADLVVGASGQANPELEEGNAFVYYGSVSGVGAAPDVTLDNPTDQVGGEFGSSVASAGDVNGDGYADLVVGAHLQDNPESDEGDAFVYYGSVSGVGAAPDVTLDNPADQANGYFGVSVASAGDVNGDGYADVVVGAHEQDNPESDEGSAFVYVGSASGVDAAPALTLDNPTDQMSGDFGCSVASAGDVNGDGYADLVVGAYRQSNPESGEGNAFVYYGPPAGEGAAPSVTLDNPAEFAGDRFGYSVASAGVVRRRNGPMCTGDEAEEPS